MLLNDLATVLLHVSTVSVCILLLFVLRMRKKQELHYLSLGLITSVFIWCASMLIEAYAIHYFSYSGMVFANIYFSAVGFISVFTFLLGRSFSTGSNLKRRHYFLVLFPIANIIVIWTNDYHHLFLEKYSLMNNEIIRGPLINMQAALAYPLIVLGLWFLLYFSIKNAGFFSKQSLLFTIGAIVPLFVDVAFVFRLFSFSMYYEPISFTFAVVCVMLAILKYDFLGIAPIALQTIVDHISDSYIVINDSVEIIDFNQTLIKTFAVVTPIKRKMSVWEWSKPLKEISVDGLAQFEQKLEQTINERRTTYFEEHFSKDGFDKVFAIEITPVITQDRYKGTIILLKDITEIRKSFELVRETQAQLIEKEHLITLGQLVGGIAHNLKTPIMSISGGIEGINDLIDEYDDSIYDPKVGKEDHHEIASEMRVWTKKMRSYCEYMSDIISTVKGQAVQLTSSTTDNFELNELLKRIDILMNHELKKYACKLNVICGLEKSTIIRGEVNSLVQIINNLIANSIEAYEGTEGVIDLSISQEGPSLLIAVQDYGCGMPDHVKEKLFKEMLTTKAKKGTGLGLYMSYSTIIGKFGGRMWFDSAVGKGTTFSISIPVI